MVAELYSPDLIPDDIVGIYSACYKVSVFMLLLVQMFRMAWQPFFLREADDPDAPQTYRDVFRYYNVVAGVCFLVVALFVQQIVQIRVPLLDAYLVGEEYWMGLHIVPILLGAYWFHGWYMNFSAGIFIKEKTKVLPVITLIGAIITIVANLVFIPYLGMMGSAYATLISYATMALLLYYQSVKTYPVDYQLVRGFGMIFLAVACFLLQPYLEQWLGLEWISRFIMLFIGTSGLVLLAWPESKNDWHFGYPGE
jgi:O-antigen/teichoic acid export membrane protein